MFNKFLNELKYSSKEELDNKMKEGDTLNSLNFISDIGKILGYSKEDIDKLYRIAKSENHMIMVMSFIHDENNVEPFINKGKSVNYTSESLKNFGYKVWIYLKEKLSQEDTYYFIKGFIKDVFDNLDKAE